MKKTIKKIDDAIRSVKKSSFDKKEKSLRLKELQGIRQVTVEAEDYHPPARPVVEELVAGIVACREAGYLPERIFISFNDLQKLGQEMPEVLINGSFFGLSISLLPQECKAQIRPKEMKR